MFLVIISISIYNFVIYLILVLSICNAIQSADCHVRYFNKLSIYLSTTWKMWSHFTSSFSLTSKLKLFLTLACNTWILLLDNWQQDIYGGLLKTEGKKRCQLYQLSHHWNLLWNYGIGRHNYWDRTRWKKLPCQRSAC